MHRAVGLAGVLLVWWLLGPWVLLPAAGALAVPRVRHRLRPSFPGRVVGAALAAVAVTVGLVVVVPDGWLPIPSGPGRWVTPAYTGRPAITEPVVSYDVPQHPYLAPRGTATANGDGWSTDSQTWAGPVGDSPEVDSSWFGGEDCGTLLVDGQDRLVTLCEDGTELRLIDPESLRPAAVKELARSDDAVPEPACGEAWYLDRQGRAVLAAADRRILVVATADGQGAADLTVASDHALADALAADDCVVALLPDWGGRTWFASRDGVVGVLDQDTGRVRATELGEAVAQGFAADEQGGMYAVSTGALYRFTADAAGRPRVDWRTQYESGERRKPGQLSQGSGTTPTLLPGGLVAIADNAEPRMRVVVVRQEDGGRVCEVPVFEDGEGATEQSLVSLGTGVVVVNGYGYTGPRSTALGRVTPGGLARVDVSSRECRVAWTSDVVAPSSGAELSLPTGLLHAWTKRPSWWGASAWYHSAIDVHTGRHVFSVRVGNGWLLDNHGAGITLTADGSAYAPTVGGVVRVRDERRH